MTYKAADIALQAKINTKADIQDVAALDTSIATSIATSQATTLTTASSDATAKANAAQATAIATASSDATTKANAAQAASAPLSHVGSSGTNHAVVTTTVAGFMAAADKVKLDAISGVNTGDQTKTSLGLGNVDNTSDINKPVSTAQAAANTTVQTNAATDATTKSNTAQANAIAASAPLSHVGSGGTAHAAVTTTVSGFMAAADKVKLDAISGTNTGDQSKASLGLGNVDNTSDISKPVSTAQAAADTTTLNNAKAYADSLVVGLLDDRGSYNASVNTFPTTGGSGTSGAVLKGDLWYVNAAGTLGGQSVNIGDSFRALTDAPAQVSANWAIIEANIGYVPYNATNPAGYTANSTDAQLRDRTTHTGTQSVSTITGLGSLATQSGTFSGTSSNTNTGDETTATIKSKLGITTLSGSNTGDQTNISGNAATVGGFTPSVSSGVGSRVVVADASGYINNSYFNSTDGVVGTGISYVMVKTSDNYLRSCNASGLAAFLSGQTMNIVGTASNANTVGTYTPSPTVGVANRVVVADASGYINNSYFNSTDNSVASGVTAVMVKTGDNYHRSGTAAALAAFLSGQTISINGALWAGITGKPTTLAGYGIATLVVAPSVTPNVADTFASTGINYVNTIPSLFGQTDGALYSQAHTGGTWEHQIYGDYRTGQVATRGKNNGTWQAWRMSLDSANYNTYVPTLTGAGASGNWSINVTGTSGACTGNAATATTANNLSTGTSIKRTVAGAGFLDGMYSGVETTGTSGAIYSIGGTYLPGTTNLGTMYGIGYGYSGNAGITALNAPISKWGLYVASGGVSRIFLDSDAGNIYINGSYNGAGTGLTGTAAGLTAGTCSGNATTASSAAKLTGAAFTNGSDGWFRSTGQAGWFNQDYAVGIYATETGNVRTYNGANFISSGTISGTNLSGTHTGNSSGTNTGDQVNISGNAATTSQRTFGNIRTDGINRGSYGSFSAAGSVGSYAGIDFTDISMTWMSNAGVSFGVYKNNSTWAFYFDANGALTVGSVPGALITGTVASATNAAQLGGVAAANYAQTGANNTFTKAQRGAQVAVAYAATVTLDLNASNNFAITTLTGAITLANPSNIASAIGQSGVISITQDGTGSRVIAYGSQFVAAGGTKPVLSTAANSVDYLTYYVESATRIFVSIINAVA